MSKPKKMQGKNFYNNARLVEPAKDKELSTKLKREHKNFYAQVFGEKHFN